MGLLGREGIVRLWKEHSASLVLYARQLCDSPEDVVQEAFLQLAEEPRDLENPTGWIYRVVRNRAIDAARGKGRRSHREVHPSREFEPWFEESPADGIAAAEATAALEGLPQDEREVIVARVWGGLSFEEIGTLRGLSDTTVFRCYRRGLEALRERLGVICVTKTTSRKN
jgi:RNA polymerase sigma factor (sigma-70 family)